VGLKPSETGQTLNAVVFGDIIESLGFHGTTSHALLTIVLLFEGALLFVAANTGFLGGPAVLANMAWTGGRRTSSVRCPQGSSPQRRAADGGGALAVLVWTKGYVGLLVVLYTVNVFITFTLSLLGLTNYW